MVDPIAFRAYVESLPAGTAVPVVREQLLGMMETNVSKSGEPDPTVAQVAARYGRSPSTVRGWILAGKLKAYRFGGHELRVTPASLAEFEAGQRVGERRIVTVRSGKTIDLTAYKHAS